jgi:integrase
MAKALVKVETIDDRVRLRWTYQGKRPTLPIGPDSPLAQKVAQQLAGQIEADLLSRNYDPTLKKYRVKETAKALTVVDLYQKYAKAKFGEGQPDSKHKALNNHIKRGFGRRTAAAITEQDAIEFLNGLTCGPSTKSPYIIILRACWKFGKLTDNPWAEMKTERQDDRVMPEPFMRDEVEAILNGFKDSYYLNYVKCLLGIGCRPGELSALTWADVDFKRQIITINKSWSDRTRKVSTTKTKRIRTVPMSDGLEGFLRTLQPEDCDPKSLVCPAVEGGFLEAHNFLNRHWQPMLKRLGVKHRPTYNTRHTVWSHSIEDGMSIADAAASAGNRPETMLRHYVGPTKRRKPTSLF